MGEESKELNSKPKALTGLCLMSMATGIIENAAGTEKEEQVIKSWPYMTFGSLIKSFFFKAATVGIIWGIGYMNWNFAWLIPPIAFVVMKGEKKKDGDLKRLTAQATALSKEKIIIENRIDELPTWVYFPDYDRAEWLNGVGT